MNTDIVIVGAGPAGIFTAIEMLRKGSHKHIVIVEKGQPIEKRRCPKAVTNHCVNCRPYCEEHLAAGVPTILEIDLQGARRVKQRAAELDLEVVYVFIAPPSFEELERRLIGRGTETAEQQARRLETAKVELAAESEFDVTIVNETVDQAAADLWSVIAKEYGL